MSSRFISGALSIFLGGFVVVASHSFKSTVLGWVALGIGIAVIGALGFVQLDRSRGAVQRVLDGCSVALGGLLIGFGVTASGRALSWLEFAFSLGVVAFALGGLSLNEVATWRSQHKLADLHWLHPEDEPRRGMSQSA